MDKIRSASEELEEKSRRIRELEAALDERDWRESAHRAEVSRLARAFQHARLRAWFWPHETRLTHYLPVDGRAPGPRGEPAGEPVSEDRLLRDIHPEDRERVALAWNRAYEAHAAYEIEYRIVGQDGSVHYLREISTPELDEAGRASGQVGITEHITERTLAEEELRRSEHRLVEAERVAGIGHWKWNDAGDRLDLCSEQAAAIFGLTADEFLARVGTHEDFIQLVFKEDRELVDDLVTAYYDSFHGNPEYAETLEIAYRIVRADGAIRHIRELWRGRRSTREARSRVPWGRSSTSRT